MNFPAVLFIGVIFAIVGILLYYFLYYRKQAPINAFNAETYSSLGKGQDTVAMVPMLTTEQINKYMAENFTLSFYMKVSGSGSGSAIKDSSGNAFAPIVWIVGVGGLLVDMNNGSVNMIFTSTFYDSANPVPKIQTLELAESGSGLFLDKWVQVTLTMNGTLACIYLDGGQSDDKTNKEKLQQCISLQNVPLSRPTGVYFLQGQGPIVKVTSVQAWPISIPPDSIKANYTATSVNKIPTNLPVTSFADIGQSLVKSFCTGTGLCPSNANNADVTLGPFTQINYEYA